MRSFREIIQNRPRFCGVGFMQSFGDLAGALKKLLLLHVEKGYFLDLKGKLLQF